MLVYYYFLAVVHGAAYPGPAPTQPARLDKRQSQGFLGAVTIWGPTFGPGSSTIGYGPFAYPAGIQTITTWGNFWNWCSLASICTYIATSCQSGTIFYVGGLPPYACAATATVCGTDYLFSTLGAQLELTRPACYPATSLHSNVFFLVSPTPDPVTTISITSLTSRAQSSSTTSPVTIVVFPTGTSAPASTQAGGIVGGVVGGVVGGLVVLALAAVISCILRRRSRRPRFAQPASGAAEVWLGHNGRTA